jgi:hypothetical protein
VETFKWSCSIVIINTNLSLSSIDNYSRRTRGPNILENDKYNREED